MREGSDGKRPLGRIQLQRRQPAPGDSADAANPGRGVRDTGSSVRVELPPEPLRVDLSRLTLPLAVLSFVPQELARASGVLPFGLQDEELLVAVAQPLEPSVWEALEQVAGKRLVAYLAHNGVLSDVIVAAYAVRATGATLYRCEHATRVLSALGEPLRLAENETLLLEPSEHELPSERRPRLLLVDDGQDARHLLASVLRARNYDVLESASGLDALDQVRACTPDLLVVEARLPGLHGLDLCRRIKSSRRYGHIPVVMTSASYRGWRVAEDLRQSYGVAAFFEKPFRVEDVVGAIERALRGMPSLPPSEGEGPGGEHLRAGLDAYMRGETEAAIVHLERGLGFDPRCFGLHYHLGLLYGKQENVFEAILALENAVELRPRDFSALKNLAVLYQRVGFRRKASEMWERALGSAPDEETRASIREHLVSLL